MQRLERQPEAVKNALRLMKEEGFSGSFTLEFTEGTRAPSESMEQLFTSAVGVLRVLRLDWRFISFWSRLSTSALASVTGVSQFRSGYRLADMLL